MAAIFIVGAGSGGVVAADLLTRDPSVTRVSLVDPDVYKPHNIHRHLFPSSAVGRFKAELAAEWVKTIRPDLVVQAVIADITDPARQEELARLAEECDIGVCAVDNETAKFAFDSLMRETRRPWTLGEVLSGGIGGWVHRFTPGGACYGCVAGRLQREVKEEPAAPLPDYSDPESTVRETTIPAGKSAISVIASLHATVTLELLSRLRPGEAPAEPLGSDFTSLLFSLARVPGIFEEPFRSYRFHICRSPSCLVCGAVNVPAGDLDAAVDAAIDRLGSR
jgi:molybdopterin/thiamine biosynthesis adenylyltransferase